MACEVCVSLGPLHTT